jgi:hypothetical protein
VTIENDIRRLADAAERIADALEGRPAPRRPVPADANPELAEAADILRYAEHLNIVINAFDGWRTGGLPSVREIRDAIDLDRRADGRGKFSSMDVASAVQHKLDELRQRPDLLTLIRAVQPLAHDARTGTN